MQHLRGALSCEGGCQQLVNGRLQLVGVDVIIIPDSGHALVVQQVFVEVPRHFVIDDTSQVAVHIVVVRTTSGAGWFAASTRCACLIHVALCEHKHIAHGEVEVFCSKSLDHRVCVRLLEQERVARKEEENDGAGSILLLHRLHGFVVGGGRASVGSYVDNNTNLSRKLRKSNLVTVDVSRREVVETAGTTESWGRCY